MGSGSNPQTCSIFRGLLTALGLGLHKNFGTNAVYNLWKSYETATTTTTTTIKTTITNTSTTTT